MLVLVPLLSLLHRQQVVSAEVPGLDRTYTTDAEFDQGTLVGVNHDAPFNNQLQLNTPTKPFPFINVAASGRGTVIRANTETGAIVGEYRTAPEGRGLNPSRTTVDLFGNVWTANREEAGLINGVPHGAAVKIGLIVGGTRVDGGGFPDPGGGYLAPPFGYSTCVDRDGDGLIRTSQGLGDILDWPDVTDGAGGTDGIIADAIDECILLYQRLPDAENARHVSVDANNNVWVGGYPYALSMFYQLDGTTGALLDSFDAREIGCGGYGGLIDGNGVLWSVGGALLRYDPTSETGVCVPAYGYGLGIDTNGYLWLSMWDGGIVKIAPDGTIVPGFPKPTFPLAMTTRARTPATATAVALEPVSDIATYLVAAPQRRATDLILLTNGEPASFQVALVDNFVESVNTWTPGAAITLTIEDGGGVVYSSAQTADASGYFYFSLEGAFDVQPGHVITVSDGTTTKSHSVANLHVNPIDVTADTVSGTADANALVQVWVHDNGGLAVMADATGSWIADFSGQTDITHASDGGSAQIDDDGDQTSVWWSGTRIQVAPVDDWVQSSGPWTPGTTVTLTIEDSSGVVYSDLQTTDAQGHFNFSLQDVFDLQRGHVVTVSDGATTKAHTVANLFVDGIDVATDRVYGRAAAGSSVNVWVHSNGGLTVTSDTTGNWTADFSGMTDLTTASDGGSQQTDDDGDTTSVWWASPAFQVAPIDDWVASTRPWAAGATIALTIQDVGGVVYSDAQTADATGNFNFNLWEVFDLQRGHIVRVSDGTATKTHTVADLYVDGVDPTADTVFGRAGAGSDVQVWVHGDGDVWTTADGSGNWTADFAGLTDLTYLSDGGSQVFDDDGDATGVWWASPTF